MMLREAKEIQTKLPLTKTMGPDHLSKPNSAIKGISRVPTTPKPQVYT